MNVHETLRKARRYLLLDRDCLYDAVSLKDGTIPDPDDAEDVAEIDALLNEIDEALKEPASHRHSHPSEE